VLDGSGKINSEDLESLKTLFNTFVFEILGLKDESAGIGMRNDRGADEIIIDLRQTAKKQ